jgi:hypothetical protein
MMGSMLGATPSRVGKTKVGGIDLNKPRMRWVLEAVIALCLSLSPHGFTASELARQVRVLSNQDQSDYGARRAAYALIVLRNKAIKPLLAAAQDLRASRGAQIPERSIGTTTPFARPCKASFKSLGWLPEHRQLFFSNFALKRLITVGHAGR